MLAYITGNVNEDLLRRIEYLLESLTPFALLGRRGANTGNRCCGFGVILHDIGKIVLSLAHEDMKDKVTFETEKCGLSPYEIEMKLLNVNHAEIGGRLL